MLRPNSDRFCKAFNLIEGRLRKLAKKGNDAPFSVLVDIASESSPTVRRFRNDLKAFAKLRNAIVHKYTGQVLADPYVEAVEAIERIARRLREPPKVIPLFQSKVHTLSAGDPITKAVKPSPWDISGAVLHG